MAFTEISVIYYIIVSYLFHGFSACTLLVEMNIPWPTEPSLRWVFLSA